MAAIDYSKIDKTKFISFLWHSLYQMAFLDIKRASDGKSKMDAFILSSCFIEYLEDFISDIEDVLKTYFNELKTDDTIFNLALDRYFDLSVCPTQKNRIFAS